MEECIHERLRCSGHPNIIANHRSTFEITTDSHLTTCGTCIIGVDAEKGLSALSDTFKSALSKDTALLRTTLRGGDTICTIMSKGSSKLTLSHTSDLVWRRSGFICDRTIGIYSDIPASGIPRPLIAWLKEGNTMTVEMEVFNGPEEETPSFQLLQGFFHTL